MDTPKKNPQLPDSSASSSSSMTIRMTSTSNIWKLFLIFVAVAFFNTVYIAKHVLELEEENQRHDLELFASFTESVNSTLAEAVDDDGGDDDDAAPEESDANPEEGTAAPEESDADPEEGTAAPEEASKNMTITKLQEYLVKTRGTEKGNALIENQQKEVHLFSFKNQNENSTNHVHVAAPPEKERSTATTNITAANTTTDEIEIKYRPRIGTRDQRKKRKEEEKKKKKKRKKRRRRKHHNRTFTAEQMAKWKPNETVPMPNISNAIYYRDIPEEFLAEDASVFLWDKPELKIPEWMKDYFRWHRWKRSTWKDPSDDEGKDWRESERWLISQCLMSQDQRKCGGTADRLKPLPVLLRVAYENKRVFLIRWTRPHPLEEFLMPPKGGFDWRIPPQLEELIEDKKQGKRLMTRRTILEYAANGLSLVRTRYQTGMPATSFNELVFNSNSTEKGVKDNKEIFGFDALFSRVWRVLFTPSSPIQKILRSRLESLGLVPNEYVASHLRALYATDERDQKELERFTENALACATKIYPGVPIFFASDSADSLRYAQGFDGKQVNDTEKRPIQLRVLTAADVATPAPGDTTDNNNNNTAISSPWHLDSYIGPVEKFYDTFVDLYMLAMAGCVTYGKGGYGHWGMLIGGHNKCSLEQHHIGKHVKHPSKQFCKFRGTNQTHILGNFHKRHPSVFDKDIFLAPMDG